MTYEEFVEKNSQNKVSAGIDNTVALILIKQLPKRYRAAHLFWSWIWVLSIPAFICVAIFYKWWVGLWQSKIYCSGPKILCIGRANYSARLFSRVPKLLPM